MGQAMSRESHHPTPADIHRVILAGLKERALRYRQIQDKSPAYRTQGRKAAGSEATLCENVAAMVQAADPERLAEAIAYREPLLRARIARVLRQRDADALPGMTEAEISEQAGASGAAVYGELLYLRDLRVAVSEVHDGVTRWQSLRREPATPLDQIPPRGCGTHLPENRPGRETAGESKES